ncbi:MAG TPA: hypothetical protein VMW07_03810 [Gallionella sp.]|jgi:hypothetical protein|nr:hypothetical protein [Gallionella sp.]
MTSIEQPGNNFPDNLPLLSQVADEDAPDNLPILTEVVDAAQAEPTIGFQANISQKPHTQEASLPIPCASNEEEIRQLLQQLEAHLESAFAHKLSANLEQLQQQTIEQAINELKTELPELLRNALNARPKL